MANAIFRYFGILFNPKQYRKCCHRAVLMEILAVFEQRVQVMYYIHMFTPLSSIYCTLYSSKHHGKLTSMNPIKNVDLHLMKLVVTL